MGSRMNLEITLQDIYNDMFADHEGKPHGVPSHYNWYIKPCYKELYFPTNVYSKFNDQPHQWDAMTVWGQVYEAEEGTKSKNTRVEIKDMYFYYLSTKDNRWHLLQKDIAPKGGFFVEDFVGDVNRAPNTRLEADGGISVIPGEGFNYHFYPERVPVVPQNIKAVFGTVKIKLILDNPEKEDDRASARFVGNMGCDVWYNMSASWDNFLTNGDSGISRFRYITNEWQTFTMHSALPDVDLYQCPSPPVYDFGVKRVVWDGPSVDFSHGSLKVSENGRFLQHADGTPFFFLGDAAWELFKRLTREEAEIYLENRRAKGFSVIFSVVLDELDGLNTPNAYGHKPLLNNDPSKPNEEYFKLIDEVIDIAYKKGMFFGVLPTWADKVTLGPIGVGPVIFNEENARAYGQFIGSRYRHKPNIIWVLGGDRPANGFEKLWSNMAEGIIEGDGGRHLLTFHPYGEMSSSQYFHNEQWLAFNMLQSGHAERNLDNYSIITRDYGLIPAKPCMDAELRYENHPINWKPELGRFDAFDARQAAYWALFAGAFGHTYGCNDIWQMYAPGRETTFFSDTYWYEAVDFEGAWDMLFVRKLMESRPFLSRIPDQSIIEARFGSGESHIQATRDKDGRYALIYIPTGKNVVVNMNKISGSIAKAYWYNPRNGTSTLFGEFPTSGSYEFYPPSNGRGNDWILVLDDASMNFPEPGDKFCIR